MATIPPPLPSRAVPPPLPSRSRDAYATPSQFDPNRGRISTRDVQRASGQTYSVWVSVNSTNVNRMKYEPDRDSEGNQKAQGTIWIEFLSGATYAYPNRPLADWIDLFESSSKGRFVFWEVRGPGPSRQGMGIWPSIKIRDGWRTSSEIKSMQRKRQPVTAQQRKRTYTRHGQRGAYGKGGVKIR